MNERWVCKRCFADNDDASSACHRCGLIRGADASATDADAWAGSAAAAGEAGGWRRWARFWWIPAIVIALAVGYFTNARRDAEGQITDGGTISVEELRVGDCFVFADEEEEVSEVDARPCSEPHEYEIYHVATLDSGSGYPTEDEWVTHILDACSSSFEAYVGRSWEISTLEIVPFTPTESGWEDGDRVIQCAVLDPAEPELTASLRDADR